MRKYTTYKPELIKNGAKIIYDDPNAYMIFSQDKEEQERFNKGKVYTRRPLDSLTEDQLNEAFEMRSITSWERHKHFFESSKKKSCF